jgi:mRNA interferase RelE/StbE
MSELPLEDVPAASDAVHEAASGRVIHITEGGQRLAAIVPESMLEALRDAEDAEDAAEADAAWDELGGSIPLEDLEAELGR